MITAKTGPQWPDVTMTLAEQLEASLAFVDGDLTQLKRRGILYTPSAYSELLADWVHSELDSLVSSEPAPAADDLTGWECLR